MRLATVYLTLLLTSFAGAQTETRQQQQQPRVRAKQPTVVTVTGKPDQVNPERSEDAEKSRNPVVRGVRAAARGVAALTGWLLNVGEDLPADRQPSKSKQ